MSDRPRVGSLFSGVGGFEMGFERAGFEVAWQVEIDRDAVSVLERHYPNVPRWRDVTEVDPAELPPVDVVTFGSPCQDMSVAGKRAGLAGERSGLFYEACRIIGGLRPAPAFCLWENVPGALNSSRGRDFGAVLDALADIGALDIGWRVLDARHFGVAQRRRRLFVVADFGGRRAGQVLFESPSGDGDSAESVEAGQRTAGDVEDGAGVAGEPIVYQCHGNNVGPIGTLREGNGGLTGGVPFVANSVTASAGHHGHSSPRGDGSDNLVIQGGSQQDQFCSPDSVAPTLAHASNTHGGHYQPKVMLPAVAISENIRAEVRETPYANALAGGGGKPGQGYQAVREGMAVRRLTPRECERLMGWPDSWTERRADGSLIPDGPRYRMIGNGVVAPVARWIGERLRRVMEQPS